MNIFLLVSLISIFALMGLYATGILQIFLRYVYGDFTKNERNKFILFGILFFCIIGVYWLLRCVKDSIFNAFIGSEYTAYAKVISLLVVFPIVIGYSYLVDKFPRHRLFYAMSAIYIILFVTISLLIGNSNFGIFAPESQRWGLLGWLTYTLIESFGSLMVVLFYSFVADTTTPESGKKGFFITATFAQLGAVIGSLTVAKGACWLRVDKMVALAALVVALIPVIVAFILWFIPAKEFVGYQAKEVGGVDVVHKKSKPGFTEGLKLMATQPYLLGILVVVAAFEIIGTIFDLQFKILIAKFAAGDPSIYAAYAGGYGVYMSSMGLIALFLGIGKIGRKIGLKLSLAMMPILMVVGIIAMVVSPTLGVVFWIMVFVKGVNYTFGQPSKEQLFIPTTVDSKYKAKTWVDMFGSRFSKATGSGIKIIQMIMGLGTLFLMGTSLLVCVFWFFVTLYLGKTHKNAISKKEVVC